MKHQGQRTAGIRSTLASSGGEAYVFLPQAKFTSNNNALLTEGGL